MKGYIGWSVGWSVDIDSILFWFCLVCSRPHTLSSLSLALPSTLDTTVPTSSAPLTLSRHCPSPVSYTHLTLPTIYSV